MYRPDNPKLPGWLLFGGVFRARPRAVHCSKDSVEPEGRPATEVSRADAS